MFEHNFPLPVPAAIDGLRTLNPVVNTPHSLVVVLGFLAALQWTSIFIIPLVQVSSVILKLRKLTAQNISFTLKRLWPLMFLQYFSTINLFIFLCLIDLTLCTQAARVTRSCMRLKKAASEVRARPYSYNDTPQLDLDSLVVFTSSLNMSVSVSVVLYVMAS